MRHKYTTAGITLARFPVAEASENIILLTSELGLVHARAQSIRNRGAKLTSALQTFTQSDIVLVRGRNEWRILGAVLDTNWFQILPHSARTCAARVTELLIRLMPGDIIDQTFYGIIHNLFIALRDEPEEMYDAAECLAALHILHALGLDAGDIPQYNEQDNSNALRTIKNSRKAFVTRINRGIIASGL